MQNWSTSCIGVYEAQVSHAGSISSQMGARALLAHRLDSPNTGTTLSSTHAQHNKHAGDNLGKISMPHFPPLIARNSAR